MIKGFLRQNYLFVCALQQMICHSPNKSMEFVGPATIKRVTLHIFIVSCQNLWLLELQMQS